MIKGREKTMRSFRLAITGVAAVLATIVLVLPAAAATIEFDAVFKETYQKGGPFPHGCDGPAPPAPGCFGGGQIRGYGSAIETYQFGGVTGPDADGCFHPFGEATITLADGSGELVTFEEYTDCRPGNSGDAPGQDGSYGNPIKTVGTWTVIDASGVFAGSEGSSGSVELIFAGAGLVIRYDGTLDLP